MAIFDYKHQPFTDFSQPKNVKKFKEGLTTVKDSLKATYPLIINGERVFTDKTVKSLNPADHKEVIGSIHQAGIDEVDEAIKSAINAFDSWKKVAPKVRADVLFKAAGILKRRRFEFSALMTKEAGKPFAEADADTAEAIDFLEYYGRQMLEMETIDKKILSRKDLERNEYRYIPLGVGVVISPWNFPLAILTGMSSAAIVSGNTILLKPAETTQVIAYKYVEVLEEAGLPKGVVNFVPGRGSVIGDYIVNHPQIRFISFTGSREVGCRIYENAAKVQKGQIWLKRVIAEMGGKDAIIVDEDYSIDDAVEIILASAFGFSGQKCSACSRAIIHEKIYDKVVERLAEKAKLITVGSPEDPDTFMGPVTDHKAFKSIMDYIAIGKKEGRLIAGGSGDDTKGYFIEPTIFVDVDPQARIMQEEIFGPVLAVTKAKDFTQAISIANNTDYGLTGAVLSNNRMHLEQAREDFHVGNLYFNRKCTGAIVGYQPFGGFNMSGTDSKAGGPDYLVLHMQGKTITEQF